MLKLYARPYSKWHIVTACTHRLLWSLPIVAIWVEFTTGYHDFMMTGASG